MSEKFAAFGTKLQIGDGSTDEAFTDIGGLRDIDGPNEALSILDATSHDSTGSYTVKKASFLDGGDLTFDYLYDPTDSGHVQLRTDMRARTLRNFRIVDVSSTADITSFAALISALGRTAPYEGLLGGSATLAVSGAVSSPTT